MYIFSRTLLSWFINICYKLKVTGRERIPDPPFIVTSNHSSLLDPPLAGIACGKYEVDFMAKKELFDPPVLGRWTRAVNCIEVNRGKNSVRSLKEAVKRLKAGRVVGIFPEGTRSTDGELQEAKRGIGFLVAMAKVPVVPVYVEGSANAMPKGKGVNFGAPIRVTVGDPIMPKEFLPEEGEKPEYEKIANMIMDRIAAIKDEVSGS